MTDSRRAKALRMLHALSIDPDANQDDGVVRTACVMSQSCFESGDQTLALDLSRLRYGCPACRTQGEIEDALAQLMTAREGGELGFPQPAEFSVPTSPPALTTQTPILQAELVEPASPASARDSESVASGRAHGAETIIITLLALIFLGAGLLSGALSGFANYQAFSSSVADPLQARVWGWAGVIASIISFGGFTFFWWHASQRRPSEALRSLLFAIAGAATSLFGTQMYISNNNLLAEAERTRAEQARPVLEAQLADWRAQLAGIPPETRSVEGLEAYLAEVERVGRTHQKPYRDAQNELGLARRRDDLQAKVEAVTAQLLSTDEADVAVAAAPREALPGWFFAAMLELFSSQGTSIGFVALLILHGRGQKRRHPTPIMR